MNATVQVPQILNISQYLKERPTEAVRTVLHQSTDMNLVLWQIPPRGSLPPHRHPSGEDIWLVLRGEADLIDDAAGSRRTIHAGESVVVGIGQTHGATNVGHEDCVLLSVVRPSAGFQPA
ncbi:cupin domain-containing protein [Lautropia mirabilis]